jgi:hypothetical protein
MRINETHSGRISSLRATSRDRGRRENLVIDKRIVNYANSYCKL